jgi:Ca2+-binding EF-hand superfamily protein
MSSKIVSKEEQKELHDAFDEMDENKDGHITLKHLQNILHKWNVSYS